MAMFRYIIEEENEFEKLRHTGQIEALDLVEARTHVVSHVQAYVPQAQRIAVTSDYSRE